MRIFLSHASEDKTVAEAIAFSLRSRGHSVFLDRDDLPAGDSYDHQIERAVRSSDVFIFLISPESVAPGRYTLTELSYARRRWPTPAGRLLPVLVRKTPMADIPSYLKAVTLLEPLGNVTAETSAAIDDMGVGGRARSVALQFGLVGLIVGGAASFLPYQGASILGISGGFPKPDVGLVCGLALAAVIWVKGYSRSPGRLAPLVVLAGVGMILLQLLFPKLNGLFANLDLTDEALLTKLDEETLTRLKEVAATAQRANMLAEFTKTTLHLLACALGYLAVLLLPATRLLDADLDWTSALTGIALTLAAAASTVVFLLLLKAAGPSGTAFHLRSLGSADSQIALWSTPELIGLFAVWQASVFAAFGHWLARKSP